MNCLYMVGVRHGGPKSRRRGVSEGRGLLLLLTSASCMMPSMPEVCAWKLVKVGEDSTCRLSRRH